MKTAILLLAFFTIVLTSCTSAYKSGQTPDDVYFSPTRPAEEYVEARKNDSRKYQGEDYYDDRYLRMKVQNRKRWAELDDWYNYDRYNIYYTHTYYWNNPWSPFTCWNYTYNPYFSNTIVVNPKSNTVNRPRTFNLNTFTNNTVNNNNNSNNPKFSGYPRANSGSSNNNSNNNNSGNGLGNILRSIFSNNNNSNSGGNSSGSSGSGNSGSSGSSAPVRKF